MGCGISSSQYNNAKNQNIQEKNKKVLQPNQSQQQEQQQETKEIKNRKSKIYKSSEQQNDKVDNIEKQNNSQQLSQIEEQSSNDIANNKNQENEENEKNKKIKGINFNMNSKKRIIYSECQQDQENYDEEDFIDIKDIFNNEQKDNKFTQKWPKYQNIFNKQLINYCLNNNNNNSDPLNEYFKDKIQNIKKQIVSQIDTYFEQIEQRMQNLLSQKNDIKKYYKDMNFQKEIIEILSQNDNQNNNKNNKENKENKINNNKKQNKNSKMIKSIDLEQQITDILNKQIQQQKTLENQMNEYHKKMKYELKKSQEIMELFKEDFISFSKNQPFFTQTDFEALQQRCVDLKINLSKEEYIEINPQSIISTYNQFTINTINEKDNQNKIKLSAQSQGTAGYLNIPLEINENYEIELELQRNDKDHCIYIGISNLSEIKLGKSYDSNILLYDGNQIQNQINKMISLKNHLINEDHEILQKYITLQISLKDSIFRWKYLNNINSTKNINFTNNYNNSNVQYLFIDAYDSSQIIFHSIKKVSIFDEFDYLS